MIPPALTNEQWASLRHGSLQHMSHEGVAAVLSNSYADDAEEADNAASIIAAMNDRLPDCDLRKITWVMVDALLASSLEFDVLDQLADALASCLKPREVKV